MNIKYFEMDDEKLTALLNSVKEMLIEQINKDFNISIKYTDYIILLRQKNIFGKMFDKIIGKDIKEGDVLPMLIRIHHDEHLTCYKDIDKIDKK